MQHLDMEDLARLVDEPANADEARHLASCVECRTELEEMEMQVASLRSLPDLIAPAQGWQSLSRRLRSEGVLELGGARGRSSGWRTALPRMAAGVALFVSGGLTSEMLRGGVAVEPPTMAAAAATPEEAEQALLATEAEYIAALTRYAELTGTNTTEDPLNRLAALEGIVLTTRAALREAPADPVINGYHLAALTQREAMLRQISNSNGEGWF